MSCKFGLIVNGLHIWVGKQLSRFLLSDCNCLHCLSDAGGCQGIWSCLHPGLLPLQEGKWLAKFRVKNWIWTSDNSLNCFRSDALASAALSIESSAAAAMLPFLSLIRQSSAATLILNCHMKLNRREASFALRTGHGFPFSKYFSFLSGSPQFPKFTASQGNPRWLHAPN